MPDKDRMREEIKAKLTFIECACGKVFRVQNRFLVEPEYSFKCPECGADLLKGEPVGITPGVPEVLPEGVERHGTGLWTYFTGLKGEQARLGSIL
jgi:hypothetical protein